MKKYLLLFVSVLAFVSCSDDDDKTSSPASVVGAWEYYKEGEIVSGVETLVNYENECSTNKDYVEFLQNGEYDDVYYNSDCEESVDYGDWTKSGNMLTNVTEGTTVEILILTETTLKIKYVDTDGAIYTTVLKRK